MHLLTSIFKSFITGWGGGSLAISGRVSESVTGIDRTYLKVNKRKIIDHISTNHSQITDIKTNCNQLFEKQRKE